MDIKTGLSIYNKPWLIEPSVALQMLDFWETAKGSETTWNYRKSRAESGEKEGYSSYGIYKQFFEKQSVIMAPDNSWDMPDFKGFDGANVAVIPVSGPMMKNDYCGSFGTQTLRNLVQMASNTESVQAIVFVMDSPGGTVDGTQAFSDTIKGSSKRTIALVDGLMCSAAYWAGCACDEIYASSGTDIIGSIGTMCSFMDNTEAMKARGVVLREYYASASTDKNRMFTEAKDGNGKLLIQELLDPHNEIFMNAVKANRAGKIDLAKEDVLTGKTYTAARATEAGLIDGVKSFEEVITGAVKQYSTNSIYHISNSTKMEIKTLADFKAQYPGLYTEAIEVGVTQGAAQEKERVKTWRVYEPLDPDVVAKGIEGNAMPTSSEVAAFNLKAMSLGTVKTIKDESAGKIDTPDTNATQATAEEKNTAEFIANVKKNLGMVK